MSTGVRSTADVLEDLDEVLSGEDRSGFRLRLFVMVLPRLVVVGEVDADGRRPRVVVAAVVVVVVRIGDVVADEDAVLALGFWTRVDEEDMDDAAEWDVVVADLGAEDCGCSLK